MHFRKLLPNNWWTFWFVWCTQGMFLLTKLDQTFYLKILMFVRCGNVDTPRPMVEWSGAFITTLHLYPPPWMWNDFWPQNSMTSLAPPSLFTWSHSVWLFLFPQMGGGESSRAKHFADMEKEEKRGIARHHFTRVPGLFLNSGKHVWDRALIRMESTWEVTSV